MRLKERNVMQIRIRNIEELMDCFIFGEELGRGNFARVISVKDICTDNHWALKIIEKPNTFDKMKYIQHEIDILKLVNHPHIIYLNKIYESSSQILLLLEKCANTLLLEYKRRRKFNEKDVKKMIQETASAITYLHKHDIVHRDLKLDNILLGKNPRDPKDALYVKLSDFGLSAMKSGVGISSMFHDFCGTLSYMAPEMLTKPTYSQQCDIWSLGVIMYTLLAGQMPFNGITEEELITDIINNDPLYTNINILSPEGFNILQRMLHKEPANRITAAEIMIHGWITNDPKQNKGAENVLDMMKRWKSDLKVPTLGTESDWISSPQMSTTSSNPSGIKRVSRQSVPVAIQNIEFNKNRKVPIIHVEQKENRSVNNQKITSNIDHNEYKAGPSKPVITKRSQQKTKE
ncbi:serine/threonine-protein kinase 33-like isoform X2 [Agrilus planipennis]|nr:serine/threonine-protein kinase 33-like isoform X2 [Agrilus planipennis]